MNRSACLLFRLIVAVVFLLSGIGRMKAQEPTSTLSKQEAPKQEPGK
jgi:uncharacterized membrane protein YphA (DoxX/SURF4 family)